MTEMFSQQGENVEFEKPVEAKGAPSCAFECQRCRAGYEQPVRVRGFSACGAGNIEVWLQRLVDGMQGTMKAIIKRAYRNVQEMSFEDFVFSHPAQVAVM